MSMGKERKMMPLLYFFLIAIFVFGFVKFARSLKSTTKVLSYRDAMCGEMLISEAILLAQSSECMQEGTLNVYEYECNEEIERISFPIKLNNEKEEIRAVCHVFTNSGNTVLQWQYEKELD